MTDIHAQQRLVTALRDPHRFPHQARSVRLIETHISWILLAGRYAYKIKKAVNLGFLDFTALEARRYYCSEEIRLNRRLAPQIYLDAVAIGGSHDRPVLGAQPAIEYAVRMRRFADSKLLDKLLDKGLVTAQHMQQLALMLARFHRGLPSAETGTHFGDAASIRAAAMQNFEQLRPLLQAEADRHLLTAIAQDTEAEFARCSIIFDERRARGYVRECHGDLHLGNIVLIGDEPVPFDGIEFNPDLRWMDVMNEIAFPAMDLLQRKHPELAFRLLNTYLEHIGDYPGVAVLRFYLAYRAMVRAKVSAIRAGQPQQSARARKDEMTSCRDHLALAAQCLTQRRPALIIMHGLPGSGKTTVAQAALERLGAIRIRSDVERKRLFGLEALANSAAGSTDIYSAEATQRTYARLLELAQGVLTAGFPVIVDAAFLKHDERRQFRELAQQMHAPFAIASVSAPDAILHARLAQRQGRDASEADSTVLQRLQAVQEPVAAEELAHVVEFINAADGCDFSREWERLHNLLAPR